MVSRIGECATAVCQQICRMDSPLNRAHTYSRKADALTAAGKYQEAMSCHNRAAENMLETLQSPLLLDNPSLVSCLQQQHQHHLKEVKFLQSKQLRCANQEARRGRPVTMRTKTTQTDALKTNTHHCCSSGNDNVLINTQNIEESIRDADTMLRFLKLRKEEPDLLLQWERYRMETPTTTTTADPTESGSDVAALAVKKPKGDKVIIEELRCLTGELQTHIKQLVQESEWLRAENQRLSQQTAAAHGKGGQQKGRGGGQDSSDSAQELVALTSHFSMSSSFALPPLDLPVLQQPPKMSSDSEDDLSDRV